LNKFIRLSIYREKTLADGNHQEGSDNRLNHIPGDENQEPNDEDRRERNGFLKDEIQIEVKIGEAKKVDDPLPQHQGKKGSGSGKIGAPIENLSDGKSSGDETDEKPERRLQNIGRASSLGEDGKSHQSQDEIENLAQSSAPAPQKKAGRHDHQSLQGERDMGNGDFDKGPHGGKSGK
jgi:hypothetical protein